MLRRVTVPFERMVVEVTVSRQLRFSVRQVKTVQDFLASGAAEITTNTLFSFKFTHKTMKTASDFFLANFRFF